MRLFFVILAISVGGFAQLETPQVSRAVPTPEIGANLPAQTIGPNDLIAVMVYDAPELTRTIRVSTDGFIRLPMVKQRIKADGLYPSDLETTIAAKLQEEKILIEPVVTVTIAQYHSRPISVAGAVKMPLVFQAESPSALMRCFTIGSRIKPSVLTRMVRVSSGAS